MILFGIFYFFIRVIFDKLVFIFFWEIICFRKFIFFWKKLYFLVFNFKFVVCNWLSIKFKFFRWVLKLWLWIMILLRYNIDICYCNLFKIFLIICWNVVGVLYSLNGIIVYWYNFLWGVVNVVFFLLVLCMGIWWYVMFKFNDENYVDFVKELRLFVIFGIG